MAKKIIGSIVFATEQGLGYLAKDFFDNGIIQKVLIREHSSRTNHREWYPRSAIVSSEAELLEQCDAFLFFEEVWSWRIIPEARKLGKPTALMPMYECTRSPLPYEPDHILTPSPLDQRYFERGRGVVVPVSVPWRKRSRARVFVHNAGNGGLGGRNGTRELLAAMQYVKSPIKLIVRSQERFYDVPVDNRIIYKQGTVPKDELYNEGDVFIFPEKFNGLSLPLQEAFAAGMLVMAGDRFPINTWLPREPLIPVDHYTKEKIAVEFDCAQYATAAIAATIDAWYDRDISEFSLLGKEYAQKNSWDNLRETYREILSQS